MKLSERTLQAVARSITGDSGLSIYRSGAALVRFFNELGYNDIYGKGFPSRWQYAEEKVRGLKDKPETMLKLFETLLDPREYLNTEYDLKTLVEHLNEYLKYDEYELIKHGSFYRLRELKGAIVELKVDFQESQELNHEFIREQIIKCDEKIFDGDYSGAITNARSLVEAVLCEVEIRLDDKRPDYDGDLNKLYRHVQKLLNLEPGRQDIIEPLKQILSGLNNIVSGLAAVRNKMSDSHVITYKPSKHHARLAVNAAMTLCDFIFETFQYQMDKKDA